MYYREVRQPGPGEIQLIDYASRIAGIAIERDRSQTALARAFEQIEKSTAQLRHIVDAIPQVIVVLILDGTPVYANQTMLYYTGLAVEKVIAPDFRVRTFHPEDIARLNDDRREALLGVAPFKNEQRILRKDGQYRWSLIQYNPLLDDQGQVIRWYATGTDIDDRVQAEEGRATRTWRCESKSIVTRCLRICHCGCPLLEKRYVIPRRSSHRARIMFNAHLCTFGFGPESKNVSHALRS